MLIIMLFTLNVVAISFPLTGAVKAPLFLMGIYYWAIYRPTLMPVWAVFIAGLAMDLLSSLPIGMNALVFVAAGWSISGQRLFLTGQSFVMIWVGFGALSFLAAFVQWAIFGLTQLHWVSIKSFVPPALPTMKTASSILIKPRTINSTFFCNFSSTKPCESRHHFKCGCRRILTGNSLIR